MLLNIRACKAIGSEIILAALTRKTQDISSRIQLNFYELAYHATGKAIDDHDFANFSLDTAEQRCNFIVISCLVGDLMSFKVLTQATQKVIYHLLVR